MPNVVSVPRVELIIRKPLESLAPENYTLVQGEANALQKQRILQTSKMLKMVILAQCHVQIAHAERKVLGQRINRRRCNGSALHNAFFVRVNRFGAAETLGKMVQYRSQAVIFVQSRQGAARQLVVVLVLRGRDKNPGSLTSIALSSRAVNSAITMLNCSLLGT